MYILKNKIHTNTKWLDGKEAAFVEETRRKLRACLIFVVTVAVIVGMVYYFHDVKGGTQISDGTLIAIPGGLMLWR